MIQEFVDRFMAKKPEMEAVFSEGHPEDYKAVVKAVVQTVAGDGYGYGHMDAERIHQIDDGDYQGTLVYVIAAEGYQPSDYWYVKVGYGSCSGCDTLEAIRFYEDGKPSEGQVKQYMTLALHVVQGLKKMGEDIA